MFEWLKRKAQETPGVIVEINSASSGEFKPAMGGIVNAFDGVNEQYRIKDIENRLEFLEADLKVEHVSKTPGWFPGISVLRAHVDKSGMLVLRKANKSFTLSKDEAAALNSLFLKWE